MTPQEIFDTVVAHARKQGKRSFDEDGESCCYRGPNGTMCFVGVLIPDKEYLAIFEGHGCRILFDIWTTPLAQQLKEHVSLLTRLQSIHDNYDPVNWEHLFQDEANVQKLVYTSPNT
jgi:hypothetical protein